MKSGLTLSFQIFLLLSMILFMLHVQAGYAQDDSSKAHSQLNVLQIRTFGYGENGISDYHSGEEPLSSILEGSQILINGIVRNRNHTSEHFDYVTEVFDSKGIVTHLDVRYSVAVLLGGQLGIDSLRPIVLDAGTYVVKVFTIHHLDTNPIILSLGAEVSIRVVD